MKLPHEITINPPPYSDSNNNIINPPPLILDTLNILYIDNPIQKFYYAQIDRIPSSVELFRGETYEKESPVNHQKGEIKLREILGNDPAQYLRSLFPKTMEENPNGPGTILSNMIKSIGIVMSQGCSCRRHAIEMNDKGNDWCEQNIDTIVGWLREEAAKRKLPFFDTIGKIMVNRAIKKSRRLLANQTVPDNDEELDNL